MKKLIILSAIAMSGLIYTSANAQDRFQNSSRFGHESYRYQHSDNRMHNDYVRPRFWTDHRENGYRNDERFHNYRENRYRDEQRFYRDNRRDENSNYRMRW